jgi:hypothetical protein
MGHRFRLLHGDFLNSFDIADLIMEGIDDFDVLDVRDSVAKMFHVIPEVLIMLLLNSLQGLSCGRMLVCARKVPDEYGT